MPRARVRSPHGTVELGIDTVISCASEFQAKELERLMNVTQEGVDFLQAHQDTISRFIDQAARAANISLPDGMNASQLIDRIVHFFNGGESGGGGSGVGGGGLALPPPPPEQEAGFWSDLQREFGLSDQAVRDLAYVAGVLANGTWRGAAFWEGLVGNGSRANAALQRLVHQYAVQPLLLPRRVQFGVATACNTIMNCPAGERSHNGDGAALHPSASGVASNVTCVPSMCVPWCRPQGSSAPRRRRCTCAARACFARKAQCGPPPATSCRS